MLFFFKKIPTEFPTENPKTFSMFLCTKKVNNTKKAPHI